MRTRSIPVEPNASPGWLVSATCSPVSVVRALLSVAPNNIWPISDPITPAARPANRGLRCRKEGCIAGVGWVVGVELPDADCGAVPDGLGVVDCSIGLAAFWS